MRAPSITPRRKPAVAAHPGQPTSTRRLVALLGLAVGFWILAPQAEASDTPRFSARAELQPEPAAVENARFRLRAALEPRLASPPLEGVGFVLQAALLPKSALSCPSPDLIFVDGFEAP